MEESLEKYSEETIAKYINLKLYKDVNIVMLNNTYWSGFESDMLVVTKDLKLIEIEIKISKQDFKADKAKKKWKYWNRSKIWKHYFCMPYEIYDENTISHLPNKNCGIILLKTHSCGTITHHFVKNAKANKSAAKLTPNDVYSVARLVNLRYWNKLVQ